MLFTLRSRIVGLGRRLVDLLGPTGAATRQSLTALGFNSTTSFVAGVCMAGMWPTFQRHPELLAMITPAIGLRGNVFSTFGNRVSTAIHMGTFEGRIHPSTVLGQNTIAAMVLSITMSSVLAVLAKGASVLFDLGATVSLGKLLFVSVVGGILASVVVLLATVTLTAVAVRRDWDLDNLVSPSVSTLGDVATVPALWLAAMALDWRSAPVATAGYVLSAIGIAAFIWAVKTSNDGLSTIVVESMPVLCAAAVLSGFGGIVISKRLDSFDAFPALLILVPAFVSSVGSLGGMLSSRLSTNLHLGLIEPEVTPGPKVRSDMGLIVLLAVPIMLFNAAGAHLIGRLLNQASPGLGVLLLATMIAASAAVAFVIALAYYGTIAAWRFDVDPDTYGVPTVTAAVDFVGVAALVLALVVLGTI